MDKQNRIWSQAVREIVEEARQVDDTVLSDINLTRMYATIVSVVLGRHPALDGVTVGPDCKGFTYEFFSYDFPSTTEYDPEGIESESDINGLEIATRIDNAEFYGDADKAIEVMQSLSDSDLNDLFGFFESNNLDSLFSGVPGIGCAT